MRSDLSWSRIFPPTTTTTTASCINAPFHLNHLYIPLLAERGGRFFSSFVRSMPRLLDRFGRSNAPKATRQIPEPTQLEPNETHFNVVAIAWFLSYTPTRWGERGGLLHLRKRLIRNCICKSSSDLGSVHKLCMYMFILVRVGSDQSLQSL